MKKSVLVCLAVVGAMLPMGLHAAKSHKHTLSSGHHAAKSVTVWINTRSGVYHYPGERWYGRTKDGQYMTEAAALKANYRPTHNGQ